MLVPLGNTHEIEDLSMERFSKFQLAYIGAIVEADDFDFASVPSGYGEGHHPGPVIFIWYTKDGVFHAERIGMRKVLWAYTPK